MPHVQYAAIRGIPAYAVSDEFARQYRRQALTLYGETSIPGGNEALPLYSKHPPLF